MHLDTPSYPRVILHVIVRPRDLIEPALESKEGSPADRALMAIAMTLMHLYGDPDDQPEDRITTIAPLFDVLLDQEEARAAEDVRALWDYVVDVFEPDSAVRELLVNAVSPRARDVYMEIVEELSDESDESDESDDPDESYTCQ
jgi:hypothetical protein